MNSWIKNNFNFARPRLKWLVVFLMGAALVGWLAMRQVLDCLFSLGCDSYGLVGILSFVVFWPIILTLRLAESMPNSLIDPLGYGWLALPVLAELIYLYCLACLADAVWQRAKPYR